MDSDVDMMADAKSEDRGEPLSSMEPLLFEQGSRHRPALNDLAFELMGISAGFRRSLPPAIQPPLANLVRAMNCYYSNLIEGHDTHPIEIERALKNDYSQDQKRRDLQLEAKAHIPCFFRSSIPERFGLSLEDWLATSFSTRVSCRTATAHAEMISMGVEL